MENTRTFLYVKAGCDAFSGLDEAHIGSFVGGGTAAVLGLFTDMICHEKKVIGMAGFLLAGISLLAGVVYYLIKGGVNLWTAEPFELRSASGVHIMLVFVAVHLCFGIIHGVSWYREEGYKPLKVSAGFVW